MVSSGNFTIHEARGVSALWRQDKLQIEGDRCIHGIACRVFDKGQATIFAKTLERLGRSRAVHLKIKGEEKEVYISVNTLAKQLGIRKSQVRGMQAAQLKGTLQQSLVQSRLAAAGLRSTAAAPKVIRGEKSSKLASIAAKFFRSINRSFRRSSSRVAPAEAPRGLEGRVIDLTGQVHTAQGGVGLIFRRQVDSLECALKLPIAPDPICEKGLVDEFEVLNRIHDKLGKDPIGIQPRLRQVHVINVKKYSDQVEGDFKARGFLSPWYQHGSLNQSFAHTCTSKIQKEIVDRLSRGLTALHSGEFIHRDIKAENILLKQGSGSDSVHADLVDFGGAIDKDEYARKVKAIILDIRPRGPEALHSTILGVTPYTPKFHGERADIDSLDAVRRFLEGDISEAALIDELWSIEQRADVNALATSLLLMGLGVSQESIPEGEMAATAGEESSKSAAPIQIQRKDGRSWFEFAPRVIRQKLAQKGYSDQQITALLNAVEVPSDDLAGERGTATDRASGEFPSAEALLGEIVTAFEGTESLRDA